MRIKENWVTVVLVVVMVVLLALSFYALTVHAQDGITNFTGLDLSGDFATATPVLLVNAEGDGLVAEFQAESTPVARIGSDGFESVGGFQAALNVENLLLPSTVTKSITYTAAAGTSGTVVVVPAGETWLVTSVLANVTADFAVTGDDATFDVGTASDADGFLDLADAELQKADTESTGFSAGWQGMADGTIGAYLDEVDSGFVIAATTTPVTVTYLLDETSGETIASGALTVYLTYTRLD